MDLEVGATLSQLDGHESTHSGGLKGRVGGSRYHKGSPSVKSYRWRVSKVDLLTILDGKEWKGKRKRKMLIGNEPHCFPSN